MSPKSHFTDTRTSLNATKVCLNFNSKFGFAVSWIHVFRIKNIVPLIAEMWIFWTITVVWWNKFFVRNVVCITKQKYLSTSLKFVDFKSTREVAVGKWRMLKVYILARTTPSSSQSFSSTDVAVAVKTLGANGPYYWGKNGSTLYTMWQHLRNLFGCTSCWPEFWIYSWCCLQLWN